MKDTSYLSDARILPVRPCPFIAFVRQSLSWVVTDNICSWDTFVRAPSASWIDGGTELGVTMPMRRCKKG
jgi:hypothetical protein